MADAPQDEPLKFLTLGVDWPGRKLDVMPGDFSRYIPQGMGFNPPPIIRPWDDPLKALSGPNYYGFDAPNVDPVRGAPSQEPAGGLLYFDDSIETPSLLTTLQIMGVQLRRRDVVLFQGESSDSVNERYLDQARIMSRGALQTLFRPGADAEQLKDQPGTVGDFVVQFVAAQRQKWNDQYTFSGKLSGRFGGDGDWAKESLCFGFLVENSYWGVYRLWSRCWLVTK